MFLPSHTCRSLLLVSLASTLFCTAETQIPTAAAAPPSPAVEAFGIKELNARGGLPNVAAKLSKGGDVRVAYLGGSITAAPGWRVLSLKWLQAKYPQAKLSEIHAAISGTGSEFGA